MIKLRFNPPISYDNYRHVYSALLLLHPGIKWLSGAELLNKQPSFYHINRKGVSIHGNRLTTDYEGGHVHDSVDGWKYIGGHIDTNKFFDALD